MTTRKICYIMPEYKAKTSKHYQHLLDFFEVLSRKAKLFVIAETGDPFEHEHSSYQYYLAKFREKTLSRIELFFVLLYLRLKGYKVFYCHYAYRSALIASYITRILGGRTYFWHCMCVKKMHKESKASIEMQEKLKQTLNRIQYIVTGSNFMAKLYEDFCQCDISKIVVIPNWLSLDRFDPNKYNKDEVRKELGLPLNKKIVLFVHTFSSGKGAGYLPDIFHKMTLARDDLHFLVAGGLWEPEKELVEFFKNSLDRYGLWDKVSWKGFVPNEVIQKYYLAADLFIMPSKFEGFSRVLLESMAMGTPFVATTGGGSILEYTSPKQQEFIIPPEEIERFHNVCLNLLYNEEKQKELSAHGLEWVKRYSIESVFPFFQERIMDGKHSFENPVFKDSSS